MALYMFRYSSLLHVAPPQFPLHAHEKVDGPVRLQVPPLAHGAAAQGSFTAWEEGDEKG